MNKQGIPWVGVPFFTGQEWLQSWQNERRLPKMEDWYQVLQISRQAKEEEIKAAYRRLAKEYHPDSHPGDRECERKFREISEAYSILSHEEKRRKYDEELKGIKAGKKAAGQDAEAKSKDIEVQNIHKKFEEFFGFNPKTKEIVHEDKLQQKERNPLDAASLFEQFMGIKR